MTTGKAVAFVALVIAISSCSGGDRDAVTEGLQVRVEELEQQLLEADSHAPTTTTTSTTTTSTTSTTTTTSASDPACQAFLDQWLVTAFDVTMTRGDLTTLASMAGTGILSAVDASDRLLSISTRFKGSGMESDRWGPPPEAFQESFDVWREAVRLFAEGTFQAGWAIVRGDEHGIGEADTMMQSADSLLQRAFLIMPTVCPAG